MRASTGFSLLLLSKVKLRKLLLLCGTAHHLSRYLKVMQMWHLGTGFSGGLGRAELDSRILKVFSNLNNSKKTGRETLEHKNFELKKKKIYIYGMFFTVIM